MPDMNLAEIETLKALIAIVQDRAANVTTLLRQAEAGRQIVLAHSCSNLRTGISAVCIFEMLQQAMAQQQVIEQLTAKLADVLDIVDPCEWRTGESWKAE
jgi:hypothetical protein